MFAPVPDPWQWLSATIPYPWDCFLYLTPDSDCLLLQWMSAPAPDCQLLYLTPDSDCLLLFLSPDSDCLLLYLTPDSGCLLLYLTVTDCCCTWPPDSDCLLLYLTPDSDCLLLYTDLLFGCGQESKVSLLPCKNILTINHMQLFSSNKCLSIHVFLTFGLYLKARIANIQLTLNYYSIALIILSNS